MGLQIDDKLHALLPDVLTKIESNEPLTLQERMAFLAYVNSQPINHEGLELSRYWTIYKQNQDSAS